MIIGPATLLLHCFIFLAIVTACMEIRFPRLGANGMRQRRTTRLGNHAVGEATSALTELFRQARGESTDSLRA